MKKILIVVFILSFVLSGLLLLLLGGLIVFYTFFGYPVAIAGHAMEPGYVNGSYWIISRGAYRSEKPKRGDVIVFKNPEHMVVDSIDRVVGLPGEKLEFKDEMVFVNDIPLTESYLEPGTPSTSSGKFMADNNPLTIPEAQYFVLGDKRGVAADSRDFGFIPAENIKGKLWFCYMKCSESD